MKSRSEFIIKDIIRNRYLLMLMIKPGYIFGGCDLANCQMFKRVKFCLHMVVLVKVGDGDRVCGIKDLQFRYIY